MSNNKLHIVTVATEKKFYLSYLESSIKKKNGELIILGYGEKWLGFNWRLKLMLEYLSKLPKNDIVCFVDGYDVLCLRNLNELSKTFIELKNKYNCKIIIGHDKQNYYLNYLTFFYFGRCNNLSINAGTYIGFVFDLINIINNMLKTNSDNNADDQILLTKYCQNYSNDFYIDINNELFLVLPRPLEELDNYVNIENNKVVYNNTYPFFIHASGYGYLDNIIIKLGYSNNPNIKNKLYYDYFKNHINLHIIPNKYYYIIIMIVIFIFIFLYNL
jgi:hypothetical protein